MFCRGLSRRNTIFPILFLCLLGARNDTSIWYVTDGQNHQLVDSILAEEAAAAAAAPAAGPAEAVTTQSQADNESVAASEPEAPQTDYSVFVRQSQSIPQKYFVYHKELKMSRWLSLVQTPPEGVALVGWDRGIQDGHEYLVPQFVGEGTTDDLIQKNALWAARFTYCI